VIDSCLPGATPDRRTRARVGGALDHLGEISPGERVSLTAHPRRRGARRARVHKYAAVGTPQTRGESGLAQVPCGGGGRSPVARLQAREERARRTESQPIWRDPRRREEREGPDGEVLWSSGRRATRPPTRRPFGRERRIRRIPGDFSASPAAVARARRSRNRRCRRRGSRAQSQALFKRASRGVWWRPPAGAGVAGAVRTVGDRTDWGDPASTGSEETGKMGNVVGRRAGLCAAGAPWP
jgi:hypothetical protein